MNIHFLKKDASKVVLNLYCTDASQSCYREPKLTKMTWTEPQIGNTHIRWELELTSQYLNR